MGIEYLKKIEKDLNRREISYDPNNSMVVSNDFILRSISHLTLNESKLLQLIITQCQKGDKQLYVYSLKATDLAKLLDIDPRDMRRNLRVMTGHLMSEYIEIRNPKTEEYDQYHWVDMCSYHGGIVTIKVANDLIPFLLDLKRDFTMIKLEELLPFKSRHASKIYQVLIANIGIQGDNPHASEYSIVNVSLDTLRIITNTVDKYPRYSNFNMRVLAPAIKEINEITKYHVTAEPYRASHAVSGIEFLIESQVGYRYRIDQEQTSENEQEQLEGQMNLLDFQHGNEFYITKGDNA